MEELSIYNLTITSDHRLKVNNEEVGGDGSILPGDSESLLAWALVQVGYIQQDSDSNMALQIEDQRPDGYGVQKVTIPPGRRVLIEALRKRTGRDLSYVTEAVQREHAEHGQVQGDDTPPQGSASQDEQWSESWDTPSAEEDIPERPQVAPEDVWTQEVPRVSEPDSEQDSPALTPPPSLEDAPEAPAQSLAESQDQPAYDQPLPDSAPSGGEQQFPEGWGEFDGPPRDEPVEGDDGGMPPLPQFAPEPEVTEHESLFSQQVTYDRNRPELGEDEVAEIKKEKKPRSKPMIAALIVLALVVVFLVVQLVRAQGENSYVATCIDERTMVRQSSIEGCKNDEASYYRWWYTPRGSEVPAVNQTVAQDQGTRIRPEEATIREDFDAGGGVYGGEDE